MQQMQQSKTDFGTDFGTDLGKTDLGEMNARELIHVFASGQASPVEATKAALARIDTFNPSVNAFAHIVPDLALEAAKESEKRWQKRMPLGAIDGVPVTIKELTPVKGVPWRCGTSLTSPTPAAHELLIVERLRQAGGVILGTTSSPAFGWKGVTDSPDFGITRNPWNLDKTAGGSSGGAAVAAALNMGVLHEGSDGGGSIRIPAAFCGVFGMKPSHSLIPCDGRSHLMGLAHRGMLSRDISDAALFMDVVGGASPLNRYGSCPPSLPAWGEVIKEQDIKGLRIGYSRTLGGIAVEPDVALKIERAATRLAELGSSVEEVDLDFGNLYDTMTNLWCSAMALTIDGLQLDAVQIARLDAGLQHMCQIGKSITAMDYIKAQQVCADLKVKMAVFHEAHDLLLLPTMPLVAFEGGADFPGQAAGKEWHDWTPFTYPFNMTGQPAASVPCGFDSQGLPIGLQLVGASYKDATVWKVASAYMSAFPEERLSRPVSVSS